MNVLVAIAAYGKKNAEHLRRVLSEWTGMQEFKAQVAVVSEPSNPDLPKCLPFDCRKLLADGLEDFDLFVYSEDDVLITERNLKAWCEVTAQCMGRAEVPGFLRYEVAEPSNEKRFPDMHAGFAWTGEVEQRGPDRQKFHRFSNAHAACYVLTRWQLQIAIDSGGYLVGMHGGNVYGYLECGSADVWTQCNLDRLIPLTRFDEFLVQHLPGNYLHMGKSEHAVREELKAMGVSWR